MKERRFFARRMSNGQFQVYEVAHHRKVSAFDKPVASGFDTQQEAEDWINENKETDTRG